MIRKDNITPINTAGMKFLEIVKIEVFEWHSLPDGQGDPEQVHMYLELADSPYPLIMRFKSRRPVDELIMALMTHANAVWPKSELKKNGK